MLRSFAYSIYVGLRVIHLVSRGSSFCLRIVLEFLQFFLVYFPLPFFCILLVRSLLVILCLFTQYHFDISATVFNLCIKWN